MAMTMTMVVFQARSSEAVVETRSEVLAGLSEPHLPNAGPAFLLRLRLNSDSSCDVELSTSSLRFSASIFTHTFLR